MFRAAAEIVLVITNCRVGQEKNIEVLRARDTEEVLEWSEDGGLMILWTGKVVEKFREEIEGAVSRDWGPDFSLGMFVDRGDIALINGCMIVAWHERVLERLSKVTKDVRKELSHPMLEVVTCTPIRTDITQDFP
jgi:hypothetical protein